MHGRNGRAQGHEGEYVLYDGEPYQLDGTDHEWRLIQAGPKKLLAASVPGFRTVQADRRRNSELFCSLAACAGLLSADAGAVAEHFGRLLSGTDSAHGKAMQMSCAKDDSMQQLTYLLLDGL